MKKLIILFCLIPFFMTSCMSLVSTHKKNMWALDKGYIHAENCPDIEPAPPREAQPHPEVPTILAYDEDGNPIELTKAYLMEQIILLFGTVEKYQVLVEIYEREYLNAGGQIMPDLTLEELKALYRSRLAAIDSIVPIEEPELEEGEFPSTEASDTLTVKQFELIIEAFEKFQEEIEDE